MLILRFRDSWLTILHICSCPDMEEHTTSDWLRTQCSGGKAFDASIYTSVQMMESRLKSENVQSVDVDAGVFALCSSDFRARERQ
ncbi:hypothetical protein MRB53_041819 [Persea americana]|nr:hypothetical protein MRB53_041819 [Persea americana]